MKYVDIEKIALTRFGDYSNNLCFPHCINRSGSSNCNTSFTVVAFSGNYVIQSSILYRLQPHALFTWEIAMCALTPVVIRWKIIWPLKTECWYAYHCYCTSSGCISFAGVSKDLSTTANTSVMSVLNPKSFYTGLKLVLNWLTQVLWKRLHNICCSC